jgi:hypothetical protein
MIERRQFLLAASGLCGPKADWLDRALPRSRGVRRVQGTKLFFPEEMPELIAEEASALWEVRP